MNEAERGFTPNSVWTPYKDSGVEFLGLIPSDWQVAQLKRSVDGCVIVIRVG